MAVAPLQPRDIEIAILVEEVLGIDVETQEEDRRICQQEIWPMPIWVLDVPMVSICLFCKWFHSNIDVEQRQPRRKKVWALLGLLSCLFTVCVGQNFTVHYGRPLRLLVMQLFYTLSIVVGYPFFLFYLYNIRDPLHYVLSRSHKQLLESALVLVSSSWVYYTTNHPFDFSTIVPFLCLDLIPCFNLWWSFDNFGFFDCCLLVLVDSALLFCRDRGLVVLMAVTVVGLALQFIKNAYRQYCSDKIKNQTLDHLV